MSFIDSRMVYDTDGKLISDKIGTLSSLQTTDKTNLVNAVNENKSKLNDLGINVKDYGAKGNGLTDDASSFNAALAAAASLNTHVYIPSGTYLIKSTLYINIEKTSLVGEDSGTSLIIQPTTKGFSGTKLLQIYSDVGDWANRRNRLRTFGHFNIRDLDNTQTIIGLSMSGDIGSSYEGHVETVLYEAMYIDGFSIGMEYGEHVYKTVSERIWIKDCLYSIKSVAGQLDAGEVPVWRACMFADNSGRMELLKHAFFEHCSTHPNPNGIVTHAIKIMGDAVVTFHNCHFEHISSEDGTTFKDPWFFVDVGATLIIKDCFGTVSGTTNKSYFKSCVIENNGYVNINSPAFGYLITRMFYDENTIATNTSKKPSFIKDGTTGHSRVFKLSRKVNSASEGLPLISSRTLIPDYTFSTMTNSQAASIFKVKLSTVNLRTDDYTDPNTTITKTIVTDTNALAKYGTNILDIKSVRSTSGGTGFYIGVDLEIPSDADFASLLARCWKVGGTNIQINESYMFFDEFGNRIPNTEVNTYNHGISLFVGQTSDLTPLEITNNRTYRRIPKNAKYVFMGIQCVQNGNTTADFYFDYFAPQFI